MNSVLKREFKMELMDLIKNSDQELIWTIEPEMAASMLEWNAGNRPVKMAKVKHYATEMSEGRWKLLRDGITFSPSRLLNGQHRLKACILAGVSFTTRVYFGEPEEHGRMMDTGAVRTPGDIFAMEGIKNYSEIAAMTRYCIAYDRGRLATVGQLVISNEELLEAYQERYPDVRGSLWVVREFRKSRGLAQPALMGALHYLCKRKDEESADIFYGQLSSGAGIEFGSAVHYLRRRLEANKESKTSSMGKVAVAAMTVKAWNAFRDGEKVTKFYWRSKSSTEQFPVIK